MPLLQAEGRLFYRWEEVAAAAKQCGAGRLRQPASLAVAARVVR